MGFNDSFKEFPVLQTERLLLRKLQPDDAEDYYNYFSNPEVTRFCGYDGPKNIKTIVSTFSRLADE